MISDDRIQSQQQERPRYPCSTNYITVGAKAAVVKYGCDRSAAFSQLILMLSGLLSTSYDVLIELNAVWLRRNENCWQDLGQNIVSSFCCGLLCKRNKRIPPLNHLCFCQRQIEFTKKQHETCCGCGVPRF